MNLKRITQIYGVIKDRIPESYPRPKLAFYEDQESLSENLKIKMHAGDNLYAVCDPDTNTVMMPMNMTFTSTNTKGKSVSKVTPIHKVDDVFIAELLLHEIAHLFFGKKYGWDSEKYCNEEECDRFARRWARKLTEEDLL